MFVASKGDNASNSLQNDHRRLCNVLMNLPIYMHIYICGNARLTIWNDEHPGRYITHQVEQIAHTKRCHRVSVTQDIIIYSKKSLKDLSTTNQPKKLFGIGNLFIGNKRSNKKRHLSFATVWIIALFQKHLPLNVIFIPDFCGF